MVGDHTTTSVRLAMREILESIPDVDAAAIQLGEPGWLLDIAVDPETTGGRARVFKQCPKKLAEIKVGGLRPVKAWRVEGSEHRLPKYEVAVWLEFESGSAGAADYTIDDLKDAARQLGIQVRERKATRHEVERAWEAGR